MKNHLKLDQSENLYRRISKAEHGKVAAADLSFPDLSVNRASLSKPEEVIPPPHEDKGICSFFVRDIPSVFQHPNTLKKYEFFACEDPLPGLLAHAEIRCFEDSVYLQKDPPSLAKTYFRNEINKFVVIVKPPK